MPDLNESFTFQAIGVTRSPFMEKFGVPRQPGLTPDIKSSIILNKNYSANGIIDTIENASHIWLIFLFSQSYQKNWSPKIRPPRLGGNKKIGVLASRSPFRPNPIGISAVKLAGVTEREGRIKIDVLGADLIDNTPILDIKPYLPYSDCLTQAAHQTANSFTYLNQPLFFSTQAQDVCENYLLQHGEKISRSIEQILRCDPRPAYQKDIGREYGTALYNLNIRWKISPDRIDVISII
jgi:tRNA-Thr(GGU) m(6)t(6)A37 methyltransferase TsaA